jgi:RHS repeat-associated protein
LDRVTGYIIPDFIYDVTPTGMMDCGTCFSAQRPALCSQFTGKERDAETGLDFFLARYYSGAQGRFTRPDPGNAGAAIINPQTWNAYSYVENNPINRIDPSGLGTIGPPPFEWGYLNQLQGLTFSESLPYVNGISGTGSNPFDSYAPYFDANLTALYNGETEVDNWKDRGNLMAPASHVPIATVTVENGSFQIARKKVSGPPVSVGLILPFIPPVAKGKAGVGVAGSFAFNPETGCTCISLGIGIAAGHNIAGGPLKWGKMFDGRTYPNGADDILSGWSLSGGYNLFIWGAQGTISASGMAGGPTVGFPGGSGAFTWSTCIH